MVSCLYLILLLSIVHASVPRTGDLKYAFEQEFRELKGFVGDLVSGLDTLRETAHNFEDKLSSVEKTLSQYNNEVKRRSFTESQVAFYAKLTTSVKGLSNHQTVIFDTIVTNTSALYDATTGIFAPPVTGMYVLSWTANVADQDSQSTELVVDGSAKSWAFADTAAIGDGDYGSSSQTIVLKLFKGMNVWIRTGTVGKGAIHGNDYSTFSGFLLFPIN